MDGGVQNRGQTRIIRTNSFALRRRERPYEQTKNRSRSARRDGRRSDSAPSPPVASLCPRHRAPRPGDRRKDLRSARANSNTGGVRLKLFREGRLSPIAMRALSAVRPMEPARAGRHGLQNPRDEGERAAGANQPPRPVRLPGFCMSNRSPPSLWRFGVNRRDQRRYKRRQLHCPTPA